MTEKKKEETTTETTNAGGEQQTPVTPPAGKEPPPKVETKTTETKVEKPAAETKTEPKRAKLKDDDDDIPDDAELLELSPTALKGRLRRASKKELRDRFGTDDPNEIKAKLDRLAELEAKEEERENANKSELEKEKSRADKAEQRAKQAEERLTAVYDARVIETEENRIVKLAKEAGMDPDYIEEQFPKFARFLNENYKERDLKKLKDKDIKKWFEDRIKAKPKLALDTTETTTTETTKEKPKAPLTNGPGNRAPNAAPGNPQANKSMKPGQANSMTRAEARAEMAKQGIRY